MRNWMIACGLVVCASGSAFAKDPPKTAAAADKKADKKPGAVMAPGMDKAMMEAWQKFATPGPEQQWL